MTKRIFLFNVIGLFACLNLYARSVSADYVTYSDFIFKLDHLIQTKFDGSEVLKSEFQSLQKKYNLSEDKDVYREFVRVRTIFEATRDSGLWNLRWSVTNKEPNSDAIWDQWQRKSLESDTDFNNPVASAIAECDELSALFALISRDLGVKKVGLFWPTWNHTVAVWTTKNLDNKDVRIVVPTSQIFLSPDATLGTSEFDPYQQKTIYNYSRKDVSNNFELSVGLVTTMMNQLERHGEMPSDALQRKRNLLSDKLGGS